MRHRTSLAIFIALTAVISGGHAARAQEPWNTYPDASNTSLCSVVNAANAELVVLSATGQLVLVTASDIILQDTFVDIEGQVFFEGEPFGFLGFAADGDGLLSLWWLTLTGTVVEIDALTALPSATFETPADFTDAGCDACDFWDDPSACAEPVVTIPLCGLDVPVTLPMIVVGLGAMGFVRRGGFRR